MTSDKNYSNRSQTRIIRIDKKKKQPLGLTLECDEFNQFRVARIIAGGAIDKGYRSSIKEGDIILEINKKFFDSVEDFQGLISDQSIIEMKIGSVIDDKMERLANEINDLNLHKRPLNKKFVCYMRALYNYDPEEDSLLPCRDIGLQFSIGDILQIVDKTDPNWWQAKKINENDRAGLIPSQELEERRKAYVNPEADFVHSIGICGTRIARKKKKIAYTSKNSDLYDKAELLCYEEVARMPPFKRKTLILIGPQGVGKRTLKQRIINSDPNKFSSAIPHTTRPQRALEDNGVNYWFIDQETMDREIHEHQLLEYGELGGYIYGTHLDTIRDVFKQGNMCVLDCSPTALKILHNSSEFLPYVIFVAAPGIRQLAHFYDNSRMYNGGGVNSSRTFNVIFKFERQCSIRYSSRRARTLESLASLYEEEDLQKTIEESACLQRTYDKYIDFVVVNEDMDTTFTKIMDNLESLQTSHQWVPVNWIY